MVPRVIEREREMEGLRERWEREGERWEREREIEIISRVQCIGEAVHLLAVGEKSLLQKTGNREY